MNSQLTVGRRRIVVCGYSWHRLLLTVFAVVLWPCHSACLENAAGAEPDAVKPNIVFVLFDDLGWGQPGCYSDGSTFRTPHLDRLATQGMRFTDAHSAAAVCTPTRHGLLTGRYPSRIGQFGVLTTYSQPIIPSSRMTVASLLRQHGYATACIGKWHLGVNWVGGKPGTEAEVPIGARITDGPNALGFDYFCGFTHARNIGTIIEQDRVVSHIRDVENQPLMIRKAVEWIDQRKSSEPFFLYFPMCPPHTPVVPSPEYLGQSGAVDTVKQDPKYGDWVFQGDAMLGRILEALDRNQLSDNTLIIATSDNGAEQRAYAPLRESKRSIYEGGHRVPFVVRWPGKVSPGSQNERPICLNDLIATAADIVGTRLPDDAGEDSVSLLPEFYGTADRPLRDAIVHQSYSGDLAIRQAAWKLVQMQNGQLELYNLETDLSETDNVLSANPETAARLKNLMQTCIDRGRSTPGAPQTNEFNFGAKE